MSVAGACTQIKTWTVTGVTTNYGINTPSRIESVACPALGLLLGDEEGQKTSAVWDNLSLTSAAVKFALQPLHKLFFAPIGYEEYTQRHAALPALIDNYITKFKSDLTLNDNLYEPIKVLGIEAGPELWGGALYYVVTFRHWWSLRI